MNKEPRIKLKELRGPQPRKVVAQSLGITPQALGMFERGERTPSLELAKKIADYYQVTVEEIFFNRIGHDSFLGNNSA